ncbi:9393_t:CDS:2 [Acaulospora colombiana]|uniref:9393_t:CDS:1 n=1 Tax=Acaulospora colombiana TaxID=27376 RepID=A0ACA9K5B5_9GLOM|nr:9393_t:CDS:2 [Acaulospora colombiana]
MRLLVEDVAYTSQDTLPVIFKQLANTSYPAFERAMRHLNVKFLSTRHKKTYMPSETIGNNENRSAKLFGLGREAKWSGAPFVVTDKTTAWEFYNHEAFDIDREMIRDWNNSLNTLLIFVSASLEFCEHGTSMINSIPRRQTALYSAVLTAFIVESMKLLEEDPADATRDILFTISKQLANTSFPAFEQVAYQVPRYAVVVNGLFFISLSCAIIASLLAVLALQWVANYDMGLNTSSSRKRALQRHARLRGIQKWKMSELIASLPLLIFVALFLFFVGIANWLWHTNLEISRIVIGGIGIGSLLYMVTNVISIINVDAPFRTPVSKELFRILRWYIVIIKNIATELIPKLVSERVSILRGERRRRPPVNIAGQSFTFTKHEEIALDGRDAVTLDGLGWLANNTEISPTATNIFIALLKELAEVPAKSLMKPEWIDDGPWEAVFEMLCAPYIGKKEYSTDEVERAKWICKGLGIIPQALQQRTFQRFLKDWRESDDHSISSLAYFASYRQYPDRSSYRQDRSTMMGTALGYTKEVIHQIGDNYFHFMLLNAEKQWPYLNIYQRTSLVHQIAHAWEISSVMIRDGSSSVSIPVYLMEIVHDLLGVGVSVDDDASRTHYPPENPHMQVKQWNGAHNRLLRAMQQQLISQISRRFKSLSDITKELEILSTIGRLKPLGDREKDDLIWSMITKHTEDDEFHEFQRICDILCKGLRCRHTVPAWVGLVPALDDFLDRLHPHSFYFYSKVIRFIHHFVGVYVGVYDSSKFNVLMQVRDPCLAWIVSWQCPSDFQFQALINPNVRSWNDTIVHEIVDLLYAHSGRRHTIVESDSRVAFCRAIILESSSSARTKVLEGLARYEWRSNDTNGAKKESSNSDVFSIRSLLIQIVGFQWFYEEFHRADGFNWLLCIANGGMRPDNRLLKNDILTEILSVGESSTQIQYQSNRQALASLKIALLWIWKDAVVQICGGHVEWRVAQMDDKAEDNDHGNVFGWFETRPSSEQE